MDTPSYSLARLDEPHDGFGVIHWPAIRLTRPTSNCCVNLISSVQSTVLKCNNNSNYYYYNDCNFNWGSGLEARLHVFEFFPIRMHISGFVDIFIHVANNEYCRENQIVRAAVFNLFLIATTNVQRINNYNINSYSLTVGVLKISFATPRPKTTPLLEFERFFIPM